MRIKLAWMFSFLFSVFLTGSAWSQVSVQAVVDRNEMGMGDTLTLSVSVQSNDSIDAQEPRVPNLAGFELVNSWNSSSTSSKLVQGPRGMQFESVRRQDFNYMLTPKRDGQLTIPGFEVVVDGKTYTTKPISIRVLAHGSGAAQMPRGLPQMDELDEAEEMFNQLLQRRGGGAMPKPSVKNIPVNPNEAFFIMADVDKTEVFEGEQILVNWYIYTRGNILSLDRLKFPDLKGFWKEIIEEVPSLNFTQEVLNGIPYRKALLASHALFPIKPGTSIIDEYKIKAQVQVPTGAFGSFGFGKPYSFQRASERIQVKVKPLPIEGKPSDFSGAVGQFDVRATIEGNQFPANQPFSLKVRFEGSGNAKLIELPSLGLPSIVEIYDTKADSKFFKNGKSYKEFEILLIPRQQGDLTIPAMNFSVFDPVAKRYVSHKTEAIPVKIVAGSAAPNASAGSALKNEPAASKPVEKLNQLPDVLVSWDQSGTGVLGQNQGVLWFLCYLAIAAVLLWKARIELGWGKKGRDLKEELQKRMKKVNQNIESNQWRSVGSELGNAIGHVLGELSSQGGASLEIQKLIDELPPSLRRQLGAELQRVVELTQILSFAPEGVVGKYKDPNELKKIAAEVEAVLKKSIELTQTQSHAANNVTESSRA